MIILLDTSTTICKLSVVKDGKKTEYSWAAGRGLAKGLLTFIQNSLSQTEGDWQTISGLGIMKGPGSFTGLRIGITVANTLADSLKIPIVGESGENWQKIVLDRLAGGENDQLVIPLYGQEANITQPKK